MQRLEDVPNRMPDCRFNRKSVVLFIKYSKLMTQTIFIQTATAQDLTLKNTFLI